MVLICIYLSLLQFELFACFLFLGEFTIAIFFYCLFLHLKASINQNSFNSQNLTNFNLILIISLFILYILSNKIYLFKIDDLSIIFIDLYKISNDFSLNDLGFVFYFFYYSNVSIILIIGIMLFVLTLFLFLVVSAYTLGNLENKYIYKKNNIKLFTKKGYYEQTGYFTQKFFAKKENTDDQNEKEEKK